MARVHAGAQNALVCIISLAQFGRVAERTAGSFTSALLRYLHGSRSHYSFSCCASILRARWPAHSLPFCI